MNTASTPLFVLGLSGSLFAQVGSVGSFTPVAEIPGLVEPPVDNAPINAPQVILGMASRYVVSRPVEGSSQYTRTALTQDFVSYQDVLWPANTVSDILGGVSDDGTQIFSTLATTSLTDTRRATVWHGPHELEVLNTDGHFNQEAVDISADGQRRLVRTGVSGSGRGYIQSGAGVVPVLVGDEPLVEVRVTSMNADGTGVVGRYNGPTGVGFWWTQEHGGQFAPVRFISDNAFRVVYYPTTSAIESGYPTDARGHRRFIRATPSAISRDGSVLAGYTAPSDPAALIWTETLGLVRLDDELSARGINTRGWTLRNVRYITDDGRTFVGTGRAPGSGVSRWWVATMAAPLAAADLGKSGGVAGGDGQLDNNDFIVFVDRFFSGDERADVGRSGAERGGDGLFDSNDFCVFIDLFFHGTP